MSSPVVTDNTSKIMAQKAGLLDDYIDWFDIFKAQYFRLAHYLLTLSSRHDTQTHPSLLALNDSEGIHRFEIVYILW